MAPEFLWSVFCFLLGIMFAEFFGGGDKVDEIPERKTSRGPQK